MPRPIVPIENRCVRTGYNCCPHCDKAKATTSVLCWQCRQAVRERVSRNLETACLMAYAGGLKPPEIAKRFGTGIKTVEEYLNEGQCRLQIFGYANLARWAVRTELLPLN